MYSNKEIEFKCPIDENKYNELIDHFDLRDSIYLQTNYYFDSIDFKLFEQKSTLRIRLKHPSRYKLTLKTITNQGALEQHIFLKENQALSLIKKGFNLKQYFDIDLDVKLFGSLDNERTSVLYQNGELFFDKIKYFNIIDYEVEYEADNYDVGLKEFNNLLEKFKIPHKKPLRKSERVYKYIKNKA